MKILIEAYSCAPGQGSEKGVGWQVVKRLAGNEGMRLTVLTRETNRGFVETCREEWVKKIRWLFVDDPKFLLKVKKCGPLGLRFFHWWWSRAAVKKALVAAEEEGFDLVHRLTFGSILPASGLYRLGLPMVVGPMGGGEKTPGKLLRSLAGRTRWKDGVRRVLFRLGLSFPETRKSYRRTAVGLGATEQSAEVLRRLGCGVVRVVPQSGGGDDEVGEFAKGLGEKSELRKGAIRLVSGSRMIWWKGLDLAIEAVAVAVERGVDVELLVLEDGPEKEVLRNQVERLGLGERVKFLGRLPALEDVYRVIRGADALVHPALNEAFGQVVLESLVLGRQVICLDWAGPGMIVTDECGVKVAVGNREEVVAGFAAAFEELLVRRESWAEIEAAARKRAACFQWDHLVSEIKRAYEEALKER